MAENLLSDSSEKDSCHFKTGIDSNGDPSNSVSKSLIGTDINSDNLSSKCSSPNSNFKPKRTKNPLNKSFRTNNRKFGISDSANTSNLLDSVFTVINDLYDQEIVPSVHEIRRKLNKNLGVLIEGNKLLKLCSNDERFEIIRLKCSPGSNDIQNEWAILIKGKTFSHFEKDVDEDLLRIVSDYLTLISSYGYCDFSKKNTDVNEFLLSGYFINSYESKVEEDNMNLTFIDRQIQNVSVDLILSIGGRYVFAEHLKMKGPKKLRNLPLGKILNLVQKLNELGLLIYKENCLIPVVNSKCAANRFILNLRKSIDRDHLEEIRNNFITLFKTNPQIPLSSIPLVYKRTFGEEFNYQEIGYDKLSDFIKSEVPFCKIFSQSNQYIATIEPLDNSEEETKATNSPTRDAEKSLISFNDKVCGPSFDKEKMISQTILNVPSTFVLYPLKITPF